MNEQSPNNEALLRNEQPSEHTSKSAFIALIGRPSCGKSTMVNALCGQKVSITARSPQTTRDRVRGIVTDSRGQLVLLDTPGYHRSEHTFNQRLASIVEQTLDDIDLALYIVDSSRKEGAEEQATTHMLASLSIPVVAALNKIDLSPPLQTVDTIRRRLATPPLADIIETSALRSTGVSSLADRLFELSPTGPQYYPDDIYTDQPVAFRIAEIIREQTIHRLKEEAPYAVYVSIVDLNWIQERLMARAIIYVGRSSLQGIVVGKGGQKLGAIRKASLRILKSIFPYPISLDLRVKTQRNWHRRASIMRNIINQV